MPKVLNAEAQGRRGAGEQGSRGPESPIELVDREYIERALAKLDGVDVEAANAIRAWMDAYALFDDEPYEIADLLLMIDERAKMLARRARRLAEAFRRLAAGVTEDVLDADAGSNDV